MTRLLLDTSAYSEYGRGVTSVHDAVSGAERIYLSPVVLGELDAGFRKGSRVAENRRALTRFLAEADVSICPVTRDTASCYAEIVDHLRLAGRPIPANDVWIAASAMEFGLVLVTFDAHFNDVPQIRTDVHTRV